MIKTVKPAPSRAGFYIVSGGSATNPRRLHPPTISRNSRGVTTRAEP